MRATISHASRRRARRLRRRPDSSVPTHHVERILPYRAWDLFILVGDVGRYPEFVPWVTSMTVGEVRAEGEGRDYLEAQAGVGFSFLTERFATSVRRDAGAGTIDVGLLRGPFKRLENRWRFEPLPQGTRVVFDIDFAFKTRLLDALLVANFDRAVNKLIACFEARAAQLYAPVEPASVVTSSAP